MVGPGGMPAPGVLPPGGPQPAGLPPGGPGGASPVAGGGKIPPRIAKMLGAQASPFAELASPVNLLKGGAPPTPKGVGGKGGGGANTRGMNRGGKVNTNIAQKPGNGPEAQLMNRASNIQR